jgi:hypothetical protein
MQRGFLRIVAVLLVLLATIYAGDYCVVRYRIPHGRYPFGQVTVQPLYVIHQKMGRLTTRWETWRRMYVFVPYSRTWITVRAGI